MGHKLFFMVCFTAVIAGVGFMAAFSLNVLPQSVYSFVYNNLALNSPQSQYPYLTKFEGHWQTTFTPLVAQSQIAQCEADTGTLTIHDGHISGTLGALNRYVTISAEVAQDGTVRGKTIRGEGNEGKITATILKTDGSGEWTDAFDCRGTFTMKKIDPYKDPSRGFIVSYNSNVVLERGGKSVLPNPGEFLYVGDVLTVPQNGSALLSIGLESVSLTGGQTYTVSEATK